MDAPRHLAFLALAAVLAAGGPAAGEPGASDWAGEAEGQARLVADRVAVGPDGRLGLGVELRLAPGWHTYWRDPGESGAPPAFDWSGSENLAAAELRWPAPRRFEAFGLDGYGWEEAVVFPVEARVAAPGEPARLRLKLDYQICEQICIPVAVELALDLPAGESGPSAFAPLLERWAARVPGGAGLELLDASLSGAPGEEVLLVRARADAPFRAPDLFAEAPPPFRFGRPRVELAGREARFALPVRAGKLSPSLAGHELALTLTDGERAVERRVRPQARP
jgi:suppressor for copper-sensitivity B